MFFWNKFCGALIFFLICSDFSYAQYNTGPPGTVKKNSLKNILLSFKQPKASDSPLCILTFAEDEFLEGKLSDKPCYPIENQRSSLTAAIPANLATCNYGFFCRQELKIENATNIPIRFRLGSLEQCNYYEGKH